MPSGTLHIVLVEDNPADAMMLKTALVRSGCLVEISVITDGQDAVDFFAAHARPGSLPCDLVLLDLNLPRLSGFEVLDFIRGREDLKGLPVVVMSGSSAADEIERCYRIGANSYICKRTDLGEILEVGAQLVRYWSRCATIPSSGRAMQAAGKGAGSA
jgi:CheY-like chemotaxis protein